MRDLRRSRLAGLAGLAAAAMLVVSACSSTSSPAASSAASAGASSAAKTYKVGYISLGDSLPFVKLVSDNIKSEAQKAGVEIVFCDSQLDSAKALACAQQLKVQGVQAVLNFQLDEKSSPQICQAYGSVPTIAIDIHQAPCEVAFMGANNSEAGRLSGDAVGKALKTENNCTYTAVVAMDEPAAGATTKARMDGMRAGFEAQCGAIPDAKWKDINGGGSTDSGLKAFGDALSAIPKGGVIVVLSLNDDMSLGTLAAARTAGRINEIRLGSQGADPTSWKDIACTPAWIADTAYFPERYGTILIPAVKDLLDGKTIEKNLFTKHQAVTKDNIRTLYPATPACS